MLSLLHCQSVMKALRSFKDILILILNTLSVEIDWNRYLNLLALDGTMIVVGLPEKETPLSASPLINARRSLAGSGIGGIKETQQMLDFCSKKTIRMN